MTQIEKLRTMSVHDIFILSTALILLPAMALMLRLFGYRRVHQILSFLSPRQTDISTGFNAREKWIRNLGRLVRIAGRSGPFRATCLVESLSTWWLLRCHRIFAALTIGIAKSEDHFQAHAWVCVDGVPINDSVAVTEKYLPIITRS